MSDTLIPPDYTMRYGVTEAHAVFFQPRTDNGGPADAISIMLPEATPYMDTALKEARQLKARVVIVCDTATQAEDARVRAGALLPDHREVALDRAKAGAWRLHA